VALEAREAPVPVELVAPAGAEYRDIDRELDDLIMGRNATADLAALLEKHQIRVSPAQRKVLLYLLNGTPRMVRYAHQWLDLAGREGNGFDFIELQRAMTLAIPEQNRQLTFMPNAGR
jgi:hypothetical protein